MMKQRKRSTKRSRPRRYTMYFLRDRVSGGYTAHIPAFEIVTEGETLNQVRSMARDAITGRVAVLEELMQPLPEDVQKEHLRVYAR